MATASENSLNARSKDSLREQDCRTNPPVHSVLKMAVTKVVVSAKITAGFAMEMTKSVAKQLLFDVDCCGLLSKDDRSLDG